LAELGFMEAATSLFRLACQYGRPSHRLYEEADDARIPIERKQTPRRKTKLLPVIRHLGYASSSGQAYLDR
jgi:hypothetical protein